MWRQPAPRTPDGVVVGFFTDRAAAEALAAGQFGQPFLAPLAPRFAALDRVVFGVPPEAKDKVLPLLDKGAALMRAM